MNRRNFLLNSLGGLSLPYVSLITGLPLSFLMTGATHAQSSDRKFCVMATSGGGQPLNICAPGAFNMGNAATGGAGSIIHAGQPETNPGLNEVEFRVNNNLLNVSHLAVPGTTAFGANGQMRAALAYDSLPSELLSTMTHCWYNSKTAAHPELRNVMSAHGALKQASGNGVEELPSAIAAENAQHLGTAFDRPWALNGYTPSFKGSPCPGASSKNLQSVLSPKNRETAAMYGSFMKSFHNRVYKRQLTGVQKSFVDSHLQSINEAQDISDQFGDLLKPVGSGQITGVKFGSYATDAEQDFYEQHNDFRVALALFYLNIAPVVTVGFNYGGDNHSDPGFVRETNETLGALESLNQFHKLMSDHPILSSLKNRVTYAAVDIFGRTPNKATGRDHSGGSTVGIIQGYHLKGTVLGGPDGRGVSSFDPNTGTIKSNGMVTRDNSLASMHKTTMSACGIPDENINIRMREGHICKAIHG